MTPCRSRHLLVFLGLFAVLGCDDGDSSPPGSDGEPADGAGDGEGGDGDTGDGDTGDGADGPGCEPAEVPCQDEHIATLMLRETRSGGQIVEEGEAGGPFTSHVDASAGGIGGDGGYTYARFTASGLERVDLSDEEALASTDWDIGLRRYIVRLNSGVSGPSCVTGARTAPATAFDELTAVPDSLSYQREQYFAGESCELVPDTSGIGAPQTVLGSFWTYPGCVSMTGNVYVLALASGKHVKLQVASYYAPAQQTECDETGMVEDSSSAGNLRLRWAFLD